MNSKSERRQSFVWPIFSATNNNLHRCNDVAYSWKRNIALRASSVHLLVIRIMLPIHREWHTDDEEASEIWQHRRNQITYFSSGGGGISWLGVFSISIIASGASGSGSGDTALSMDGAASPSAGSVAFPALLPNLTDFMKPFRVEKFRLRF